MQIVKLLLSNKVLISALFSWVIAQFLKIIIELIKKKKFKTKDFFLRAVFGTGGMPSSHSATVVAVAVSVGFQEGFDSAIFGLALVLVIIVIRDATGVRFSSGLQAQAINQILEKQHKLYRTPFTRVKEIRGHTPLETFVGAIVGILVSVGLLLLD